MIGSKDEYLPRWWSLLIDFDRSRGRGSSIRHPPAGGCKFTVQNIQNAVVLLDDKAGSSREQHNNVKAAWQQGTLCQLNKNIVAKMEVK